MRPGGAGQKSNVLGTPGEGDADFARDMQRRLGALPVLRVDVMDVLWGFQGIRTAGLQMGGGLAMARGFLSGEQSLPVVEEVENGSEGRGTMGFLTGG